MVPPPFVGGIFLSRVLVKRTVSILLSGAEGINKNSRKILNLNVKPNE